MILNINNNFKLLSTYIAVHLLERRLFGIFIVRMEAL